ADGRGLVRRNRDRIRLARQSGGGAPRRRRLVDGIARLHPAVRESFGERVRTGIEGLREVAARVRVDRGRSGATLDDLPARDSDLAGVALAVRIRVVVLRAADVALRDVPEVEAVRRRHLVV